MALVIDDDVDMGRLLKGLADDILDAHIHYKMHNDLIEALNNNPVALRESNTFWHRTISAHIIVSQTALARAYDQHKDGLHLRNWLVLIGRRLELFSTENFRKRMADNPHVEILAVKNRIPDQEQLKVDIELCSRTDSLVKILVEHRDKEGAHRSGSMTAKGLRINDKHPLTYADFETLLKRALEILHRYSVMFEVTWYSTNVLGRYDFQAIIQAMNEQDDRRTAEMKEALDSVQSR